MTKDSHETVRDMAEQGEEDKKGGLAIPVAEFPFAFEHFESNCHFSVLLQHVGQSVSIRLLVCPSIRLRLSRHMRSNRQQAQRVVKDVH